VRASRGRDGFAAALAVCFLAVLGGVAAASFYTVVEARRSANRSARQEQAATAADIGLFATLDRWSVKGRDSLPIGSTDSGSAYVTRLADRLYWVTAAGEAARGTSVRAVRIYNLLVEILRPSVPARAAITSAGAVLAGPDAVIDGSDSHPPGWTDCPPADTTPAPAVLVSEDSVTYEWLGRVATATLAARADITLPAGAVVSPRPDLAGHCKSGDSPAHAESWGEPERTGQSPQCERFFPVVHAVGALGVTSGRGQGVLVVNGRLRIDGPFLFHGLVIAAGGIEVHGQDVTIYGAVLSAERRGIVWDVAGQVRRSTCAVSRASDAAARPYPVPRRAWAELF
jgi:hypothetical protein